MKALNKILAFAALLGLAATGCDQPRSDESRTDAEALELSENPNTLETETPIAPQASTERDIPGSDAATLVTKRTIIDNAAINSELSTFSSLLQSANLIKNLSGTGPYTVLAPSDDAFTALPDSIREGLTKPDNEEQLQQILNNHVIAGKLTTEDLQDGAMLKTAAGHQLRVYKRDGIIRIGGARVVDPDGMSRNGVLHTINRVLIPVDEN
jgi:uncharacterized surface protein with fasciclin (FAS1) repeats